MESFISKFSTIFALKDLGTLSYFLGVEVLYNKDYFYLSQRKNNRDLPTKVDMLKCKGIDTPLSIGLKLQRELYGDLGYYIEDPIRYRNVVESTQYLVLIRLDIAFVVHKLS